LPHIHQITLLLTIQQERVVVNKEGKRS